MADVVLDMSAGSTEPILQAIDLARIGGRIVLAGLKNGKPVNGLMTDKIVANELQLLGGFASTRGFAQNCTRNIEGAPARVG